MDNSSCPQENCVAKSLCFIVYSPKPCALLPIQNELLLCKVSNQNKDNHQVGAWPPALSSAHQLHAPPTCPCPAVGLTSASLPPTLSAVSLSGLSNIIGIIVYISSNTGDPSDKRDEDKKNHYNYGWSFYFGALSFIVAETVGVLAVNIYIEKNKELRFKTKREFLKGPSSSPYARMPSYRYRRRRSRSSSRSTEASPSRDTSPVGLKITGAIPMGELSMYTLSREPLKVTTAASYSPDQDAGFLQVHDFFQQDLKEGMHISMLNRRTTPV